MTMRYGYWALVLFLVAGCTAIPVSTDYDPAYRFGEARSFAWLETGSRAERDPARVSDLEDARIRRAVEERLRARGMGRAESVDEADVLLAYHMGIQDRVEIRGSHGFHPGLGYYPCFYPCTGFYPQLHPTQFHHRLYHEPWVEHYQSGRLVIDMIDAETRRLVWQGSAERRRPRLETPERRDRHTRETVQAILERFPPR